MFIFSLLGSIFIIVILAFLNITIFLNANSQNVTYGDFTTINQTTEDNVIKKDTIYFVGDVMLGRHVEELINLYGISYPFQNITFPKLENSYVVGNFESSISKHHTKTPDFHFQFSTNPKYIIALKNIGFTHLSLANNHAFDYGIEGYKNAKTTLENDNIKSFGHPAQIATSSVTFIELKNHKIAIIGIHNLFMKPTPEDIKNIFSWSSRNSDFQIAFVHWGTEYSLNQSQSQREFAKELVEAGADLVIGHHPHVVQGIEEIENSLVFYSLGNFIFDQYFSKDVREGLVLALHDNESGIDIELLPISSSHSLSQPSFMTKDETSDFLTSLTQRSQENLNSAIKNQKIALINRLATSTETVIMTE